MSQIKKSTRYLLVQFRGTALHKKFYRRGGHRFNRGEEVLIDVLKTKAPHVEQIVTDKYLVTTQLTERQAEKYLRLLKEKEKKAQQPDKDDNAATEALEKYRRMYRNERERADEMTKQNGELIEALDLAAGENDKLKRRNAELEGYLELLEAEPSEGAGSKESAES